jgi:hypothetical protein
LMSHEGENSMVDWWISPLCMERCRHASDLRKRELQQCSYCALVARIYNISLWIFYFLLSQFFSFR